MKPDPNMITLSFYKEILLCLIQSCCVPCSILFYLWVNVFSLPLLVGHSSRVPPKRKKRVKKIETAQPAGTVHEFCFVKPYPILRTLRFYKELLKVFSNVQTFSVVVDTVILYSMQYPFLPMG